MVSPPLHHYHSTSLPPEKTEALWKEKYGEHENRGLSEKAARAKAFEFVFGDDKKEFLKLYSEFLLTAAQLNDSVTHQKILRDITDSDVSDRKTVRRVLKKYNHWFHDIVSHGEMGLDSETSDDDD